MSDVYVSVEKKFRGMTAGGFNTRFCGDTAREGAVTAECGYCLNTVQCAPGEAIYLDDPRLCEHVKHPVGVGKEQQRG